MMYDTGPMGLGKAIWEIAVRNGPCNASYLFHAIVVGVFFSR